MANTESRLPFSCGDLLVWKGCSGVVSAEEVVLPAWLMRHGAHKTLWRTGTGMQSAAIHSVHKESELLRTELL